MVVIFRWFRLAVSLALASGGFRFFASLRMTGLLPEKMFEFVGVEAGETFAVADGVTDDQ
jgi:hypothetical protein